MTSVGFPYFLDLPNELQGVIWYFVAIGASTHQQASLVLVSKSSRPWIESILYRDIHIIKRYSTKSLSLLSGITQSPGLFSNTIASLWLVVYDLEGATLALSALSTLHNLRKAFVYVQDSHLDVLRCLLTLPNLKEARFDLKFNKISSSQCSDIMMTHMGTPITHVVVGNWELGAHFLHLFPRITHLAVICYGLPQLDWVQMWCSATTESLQTFVLIDGWSSWLSSSDNDDVVFLNTITTHPSFTVKLVLFRVTQFLETWHEISSMWKAVEEAIDSSNRNTLESGGQHFIEVND